MIEYMETRFSMLDLIVGLQEIVSANPEIDFSRVDVSLAGEYTCNNAELNKWEPHNSRGNTRVCVDLF